MTISFIKQVSLTAVELQRNPHPYSNPTATLQLSIVVLLCTNLSALRIHENKAAHFALSAWLLALMLIALPIILNKKLQEVNHFRSCP